MYQLDLHAFDKYTLDWKVLRLKEVLTITENNIKIASGYYLV